MSRSRQNVCNEVISTVYKSTFISQRKANSKPEEKTSKSITNRPTTKRNEKGKKSNKQVVSKKVSKCVIDFGVNTLISGPKLCDSNCVTSVTTGGSKKLCKCGRKVNFKMVDHCTQYFDTVNNCSTQCPKKCSVKTSTNIYQLYNTRNKNPGLLNTIRCSDMKQPGASFVIYENLTPKSTYKPKYPVHLAVNRWAISRNPIRGPDF